MKSEALNGLNSQQKKAATHLNGPALILAGAGSGKTKTLIHRIAFLIHSGIPSKEILAMTFTNLAAKEIKHRVQGIIGINDVFISTFHSVCLKILRDEHASIGYSRNFIIYDTKDSLDLIESIIESLNIELNSKKAFEEIEKYKNLGLYDSIEETNASFDIKRIFNIYEKKLLSIDAMDFSSIINNTTKLFRTNIEIKEKYVERFKYIMVDEYQDTNEAQLNLIYMFDKYDNIFFIGDIDQMLYSWRGVNIDSIINFSKKYPTGEIYALEENYRSTKTIIESASSMIKNNTKRIDKDLFTRNQVGSPIQVISCRNNFHEAELAASKVLFNLKKGDKNIAVIYRNNYQSKVIEDQLMMKGIPYSVLGGQKFFDRKEIKDIISYFKCIVNNKDVVSFKRIINTPRRGIGDKTVETLLSKVSSFNGDFLKLLKSENIEKKKKINEGVKSIINILSTNERNPLKLFDFVINETGYLELLTNEGTRDSENRKENLLEFRQSLMSFSDIYEFLNNFLIDSESNDMQENVVKLMTIHASKGLEFDTVIIIGNEENVFPSVKSLDDQKLIEEERRLFYVALTRAKNKLYLLYAKERLTFGKMNSNNISRFISEIPNNNKDYQNG